MSAPPFTLVTGNPNKLREAERLLGARPASAEVDLPEIQSLDVVEVLHAKGQEAWQRLERPVVVDETSLELHAMGGFPGPLVKWMLEAVGAAGIARTAHALDDPRATARCVLLYRDAERSIVTDGAVKGQLVASPRGQHGFGWDPIFQPEGSALTFAEIDPDAKDLVGHRGHAWRALHDRLREAGIL